VCWFSSKYHVYRCRSDQNGNIRGTTGVYTQPLPRAPVTSASTSPPFCSPQPPATASFPIVRSINTFKVVLECSPEKSRLNHHDERWVKSVPAPTRTRHRPTVLDLPSPLGGRGAARQEARWSFSRRVCITILPADICRF
jgi:hypothetical protein